MYPMSWRGKDAQFFRLSSWDSRASNQDIVGFAKWELLLLADVFQGIHQLYSQICLSYLILLYPLPSTLGTDLGWLGSAFFPRLRQNHPAWWCPEAAWWSVAVEAERATLSIEEMMTQTSRDIKRQAATRTSIVFDSQGCFTMFYLCYLCNGLQRISSRVEARFPFYFRLQDSSLPWQGPAPLGGWGALETWGCCEWRNHGSHSGVSLEAEVLQTAKIKSANVWSIT